MRFKELDSLRGIASLIVMFSHYTLSYASIPFLTQYNHGLFHLFWSSSESVILFFVLSGFVLSLQFYTQENIDTSQFIAKRFFRIYIPYLFTILLGLLFYQLVSNYNTAQLGLIAWSTQITYLDILKHIILIGQLDTPKLNPVIWSLVHEMRVSLIFPILIYLIKRFNLKTNIAFSLCLYIGSSLVMKKLPNLYGLTSYFMTLHYLLMFIIGALLAKHCKVIVEMLLPQNNPLKWILLGIGITTYCYSGFRLPHLFIIDDFFVTIGSCIFIILAIQNKELLCKKPLVFFGKISYSVYLIHYLVLLTIINLLPTNTPSIMIVLFATLITFVLSVFSYNYIEKPSILLGKLMMNSRKRNVYGIMD